VQARATARANRRAFSAAIAEYFPELLVAAQDHTTVVLGHAASPPQDEPADVGVPGQAAAPAPAPAPAPNGREQAVQAVAAEAVATTEEAVAAEQMIELPDDLILAVLDIADPEDD